MPQRDLFPPSCHARDPATSGEAAERVTTNGTRARHARLVLELVRRYPLRTAIELWMSCPHEVTPQLKEAQEVRRRLVDLEYQGLVRKGPARRCIIRGTRMVTWEATV